MTRFPENPVNLSQWAIAKWREADVARVRAAGEQQARDNDQLHPRPARRIDWGALNCAFWVALVIVMAAVTIAAVIR